MRGSRCTLIAAAFIAASSSAHACEYDPFLFQLSGETVQEAQKRSDQIFSDYRIKQHFDREKIDFDSAALVYLGRVVSTGRTTSNAGRKGLPFTSVHPLTSFRGKLPKANEMLVDELEGGMCSDVGDGLGADRSVGDLVVVFEGVPKTEFRPRGVDSFQVSSIRTLELLDWLRKQGKDLEE
jgi:hypothetical protein